MRNILNKIPLWIINLITILSGILTVVSFVFGFFSIKKFNIYVRCIFLILTLFLILLFFQLKKYQKLDIMRLKAVSFNYHKLLHSSRDLYFNVLKQHKNNNQNIQDLGMYYKNQLSKILNYLCDIMETYCGQEIFSCIKMIVPSNINDIDKIELMTLCRSDNSDTMRGNYENKLIKLIDNTDFIDIIDTNSGSNLNYFYKTNLIQYDKDLRKEGKIYKNSNPNWQNDYIGTIVVPIQIEHKFLYDTLQENSYNVIGFLCIDSKSESAFLKRQERYNVDIVKSFADIIYVLLSQYQYYLNKLKNNKSIDY